MAVAAVGGWLIYRQTALSAPVAKVVRGTAFQLVPANVTVFAETMEVRTEQSGRIIQRHVKLGQEVKAGDLLFEIDPRDIEIEIAQIETQYKATKARLELGSPLRFDVSTQEENLKNSTRLFESGRLAKVELDRAQRALQQLKDRLATEEIDNRERVENLENQLRLRRRARDKMNILAPADGTITEPLAQPGALVGGGSMLARVISRTRIVQAQISEENFAGVRPGLPVKVSFLGHGGKNYSGKVESLLPTADERTKRYTALLSLDMPVEELIPDLTGEAGIMAGKRENTLLVPRASLAGGRLWLVRDGRVEIVKVNTGYVASNVAEITEGVKEGDLVIVGDLSLYKAGQRVRSIELKQQD